LQGCGIGFGQGRFTANGQNLVQRFDVKIGPWHKRLAGRFEISRRRAGRKQQQGGRNRKAAKYVPDSTSNAFKTSACDIVRVTHAKVRPFVNHCDKPGRSELQTHSCTPLLRPH
jgi:hypothetical protein